MQAALQSLSPEDNKKLHEFVNKWISTTYSEWISDFGSGVQKMTDYQMGVYLESGTEWWQNKKPTLNIPLDPTSIHHLFDIIITRVCDLQIKSLQDRVKAAGYTRQDFD